MRTFTLLPLAAFLLVSASASLASADVAQPGCGKCEASTSFSTSPMSGVAALAVAAGLSIASFSRKRARKP